MNHDTRTILFATSITLVACAEGYNAVPDPTRGQGGSDSASGSTPAATVTSSAGTGEMGDAETDGTRLKHQFLVGEDGFKARGGYFDTQLGVSCYFSPAADGQLRCLPASAATLSPIQFADDACTIPAALAGCGPKPPYVRAPTPGADGCTNTSRIHEIGEPATAIWNSFSAGDCEPGTIPAGYTAYLVGAELPSSSFVAGTIQ